MTTLSKPSLPYPTLCLVTERAYAQRESLATLAAMAIAGGANMIQLREKDLSGGDLLFLAQQMRTVTQGKAFFLVNGPVDIAVAAGADGVQLGEESISVETVRRLFQDRLLVGRSVHSKESAQDAEALGADFLIVGTIFPTASKAGVAPAGLQLLSQIAKAVAIPFLAIGGVNQENVAQVMEQGCSGVAVISAILGAEDPRQASHELKKAMLPRTPSSLSRRVEVKR